MKTFQIQPFLILFLFIMTGTAPAASSEPKFKCDAPFWNAPAESNDGIFSGDLSVNCSFTDKSLLNYDILRLRKQVISKIEAESIVNVAPNPLSLLSNAPLSWDVSHRFEEDDTSIQIRESITLSIERENKLKYETHSKEISASGMAGYLKSVEFTMIIDKIGTGIKVHFQNKVKVKRPWYALDLIFAPIARKICFKKLNQVIDKFMPWIVDSIKTKEGVDSADPQNL